MSGKKSRTYWQGIYYYLSKPHSANRGPRPHPINPRAIFSCLDFSNWFNSFTNRLKAPEEVPSMKTEHLLREMQKSWENKTSFNAHKGHENAGKPPGKGSGGFWQPGLRAGACGWRVFLGRAPSLQWQMRTHQHEPVLKPPSLPSFLFPSFLPKNSSLRYT